MSIAAASLRMLVYSARYCGSNLELDLNEILTKSTHNNRRDGITGALLVDGLTFVQAVEGPPDEIERLFGRICADRRCAQHEVLLDQPASGRSAFEWTLHVAHLDTATGIDPTVLRAFRDAYIHGFKADVAGFIDLLHVLLTHGAAAGGPVVR